MCLGLGCAVDAVETGGEHGRKARAAAAAKHLSAAAVCRRGCIAEEDGKMASQNLQWVGDGVFFYTRSTAKTSVSLARAAPQPRPAHQPSSTSLPLRSNLEKLMNARALQLSRAVTAHLAWPESPLSAREIPGNVGLVDPCPPTQRIFFTANLAFKIFAFAKGLSPWLSG